MKIAVLGNTGLNVGIAAAGDLALAGHRVSFALWPDQKDVFDAVTSLGGIEISPPVAETLSGQAGIGRLHAVTADFSEALADAELVVIDVAAAEVDRRFADLVPHLRDGQTVHINTHGYWPSLRVAGMLRDAGKTGVTMTEGIAPTVAAGREGAVVTPHCLRRNILTGVFPAERSDAALPAVEEICHSLEPAKNVLHSNLGSMNFLIHTGMAMVNIGYFDRAEAAGEPISFYGTGNTVSAGRLTDALDRERIAVCAAYDVPYRPVGDQIARLYGAEGGSLVDVVANSPFYRNLPGMPADTWRSWMAADLPLTHVPFVLLAEHAALPAPLHRGFVDIMNALLESDHWRGGLALAGLGLEGLSVDGIKQFVETGRRS